MVPDCWVVLIFVDTVFEGEAWIDFDSEIDLYDNRKAMLEYFVLTLKYINDKKSLIGILPSKWCAFLVC